MNVLSVTANLTRDAELSFSKDNTAYMKSGIAINDGFGDNKKTIFLDIVQFGKPAEWNGLLKKGAKITACGRLTQDEWVDKATGNKRTKISMICDEIIAHEKTGVKSEYKQEKTDDFTNDPWAEE